MMDHMENPPRHVLLVGVDRGVAERMVPLLQREELQVLSTDPAPPVLNLLRDTPFDLLVVAYPLSGLDLEELLATVRSPESPSRRAGVVLLAPDDALGEAASWEQEGVNRVTAAGWTDAHLWQAVADLLHVAPRAGLRVLVRLDVEVDGGLEQELSQTVNLSASGMLLEAPSIFRPGTELRFTFRLPGEARPVSGTAEVVRVSRPHKEGVQGFAVRFLGLEDDGAERIAAWFGRREPAGNRGVAH